MRIAITGGPKSGKTTLAEKLGTRHGLTVLHTDDLIPLGWDAAIEATALWFDTLSSDWIIEGAQVARALRYWLQEHPEGLPCDQVIYLVEPKAPYTKNGQEVMAKGIATVMAQIEGRLLPILAKPIAV